MKNDNHNVKGALLDLFRNFEGREPSDQQHEWTEVEKFVSGLSLIGWSRSDIYYLIIDLFKNNIDKLPVECLEALGNYIDGLIGQVSIQHIIRLPNEIGDENTHAQYVRSMDWLTKQ